LVGVKTPSNYLSLPPSLPHSLPLYFDLDLIFRLVIAVFLLRMISYIKLLLKGNLGD